MSAFTEEQLSYLRSERRLASVDPWRPRGVEVRGRAEALEAPVPQIRIHPDRIVSWGLGGAA